MNIDLLKKDRFNWKKLRRFSMLFIKPVLCLTLIFQSNSFAIVGENRSTEIKYSNEHSSPLNRTMESDIMSFVDSADYSDKKIMRNPLEINQIIKQISKDCIESRITVNGCIDRIKTQFSDIELTQYHRWLRIHYPTKLLKALENEKFSEDVLSIDLAKDLEFKYQSQALLYAIEVVIIFAFSLFVGHTAGRISTDLSHRATECQAKVLQYYDNELNNPDYDEFYQNSRRPFLLKEKKSKSDECNFNSDSVLKSLGDI